MWSVGRGFHLGQRRCKTDRSNYPSLVKPSGRIWIVPDGDPAVERFATDLLTELSPHRFVRWKKLAEGKQPTDLSPTEVKACFIM